MPIIPIFHYSIIPPDLIKDPEFADAVEAFKEIDFFRGHRDGGDVRSTY